MKLLAPKRATGTHAPASALRRRQSAAASFPCASAAARLASCVILMIVGCRKDDDAPPPPPATAATSSTAIFTDIAAASGLSFSHDCGHDGRYSYPEIMGAGCALLDYDNDGDLDIYLVNGGPHHGPDAEARSPSDRLFAREADGTYRDVTSEAGIDERRYGMGVTIGDYNNDGFPDIYVLNYGADRLYRNNGNGTFADVTEAAGIRNDRWSVSGAFFDYDLDGFLDLFVVNYVHYPEPRACADAAGRVEYCGPTSATPVSDVLYRNRGDGTFEDVSAKAGMAAVAGHGLGVVCEDYNGDGRIDIYVANDGSANHLWINRGDGTFVESAVVLGAAVNRFGKPEGSMGVTAGDVDGDGRLDLFMTHIIRESNTLYRAHDGWFEDATAEAGLVAPSMPYTGFGTMFVDLNLSGHLDLLVVNGRVKRAAPVDGVDAASPVAAYAERSLLFLNDGRGRFRDATATHGGDFGRRPRVSRGLAIGDIDNDGDIDALVTNTCGPVELLRNDAPRDNHGLTLRLVDPALHRDAYGAKITAVVGDRQIVRTVNPNQSYASSNDPRVFIGLGSATRVDSLEVVWPDGLAERFQNVLADQQVIIRRGGALARAEAP
jgi:hypothetical protein